MIKMPNKYVWATVFFCFNQKRNPPPKIAQNLVAVSTALGKHPTTQGRVNVNKLNDMVFDHSKAS